METSVNLLDVWLNKRILEKKETTKEVTRFSYLFPAVPAPGAYQPDPATGARADVVPQSLLRVRNKL